MRVFENRVLRRILEPKRDEVTREWRKLHEELKDLYSSPSIVRVIKWGRMRWVGHLACTGERKGAYRILVGKTKGKNHMGDPGIDGRFFRKWDVGEWTGSNWLRIGTGGGPL